MPTIFTRIIKGEFPGRFVWKDDACVAFLSIHPLRPGHTLVVPRAEVDHWIDLEPALAAHLMGVSQSISTVLQKTFSPVKVGMMIAGLEVPHTHIHLVPIRDIHDLDFDRQDKNARAEDLDKAAEAIRQGLKAAGYSQAQG